MELHTKQLQRVNSTVAAQFWPPSKCLPGPPQ